MNDTCEAEFTVANAEAERVSDLDTRGLPAFVAAPLQAYLDEIHPTLKLWRMCDTVELTLRYLTVIVLAHLRDRETGCLPDELAEEIGEPLRFPTLAKWRFISERALEALDEDDVQIELLVGVRKLLIENIWTILGSQNGKEQIHLLSLRNFLAHAGPLSRVAASELLQAHRERFEKTSEAIASCTATHDLRLTTGINAESRLLGANPTRLPAGSDRPAVILHAGRRKFDLSPFCGVAHAGCDEEVLPKLYVRANRGKIHYNVLLGCPPFQQEGGARYRELSNLLNRRSGSATKDDATWGEIREDAHKMVGREFLVRRVADLLIDSPGQAFWLWGPPGSGKSIFSASVCETPRLAGNPRHVLRIVHRFKAGERSRDRFSFLQSSIDALAAWKPLQKGLPELCKTAAQQRDQPSLGLLINLLDGVSQLGVTSESPPRVVVALDGLDELAQFDPELVQELPSLARPLVSLLLSGRRTNEVRELLGNHEAVRPAIPSTKTHPEGGLPPLSLDEVREILMNELDVSRYELLRDEGDTGKHCRYVEEIARRANGWPLYVVSVAERIAEGQIRIEDGIDALPASLDQYYHQVLNQISISDVGQVLTPLLATLAICREALHLNELSEILAMRTLIHDSGEGKQLVADAIASSAGLVVGLPSSPETRYAIHHETLREFLLSEDGPLRGAMATARVALCVGFRKALAGELPASRAFFLRRGLRLVAEEEGVASASETLIKLTLPLALAELQDPHTWATAADEIETLMSDFPFDLAQELPTFMRQNQHVVMRGGAASFLSAASAHGSCSGLAKAVETRRRRPNSDAVYWLRPVNPPAEPNPSILLRSLCGHPAPIGGAQPFGDRNEIYTVTYDGIFRIWDICTGVKLREFRPDGRETIGAAHVTGTNTAFIAPEDGNVRLIELERGEVIDKLPHKAHQLSIAESGERLATSNRSEVIVWCVAERAPISSWPLPGTFHRMALSPTGVQVAVAYEDPEEPEMPGSNEPKRAVLVVWEVERGDVVLLRIQLPCLPKAVCWLNSELLSLGYPDGRLEVWRVERSRCEFAIQLGSEVGETRLLPGGDVLATTRQGDLVRVNLVTGPTGHGFVDKGIANLDPVGEEDWVVYGMGDSASIVRTPEVTGTAPTHEPLLSVAEGPEGSLQWTTAQGRVLRTTRTAAVETHSLSLPFEEAVAGDLWGSQVAFGSGRRVVIYDLVSGNLLSKITTFTGEVTGLWLCSDGSHVICRTDLHQYGEIWNFKTEELVSSIYANQIEFDTRRTKAVAGGRPARVLGFGGKPQTTMDLGEEPTQAAAIRPDGQLAATVVGDPEAPSVLIWDIATGTPTRKLRTRGRDTRKGSRRYSPASLRFAANGNWLAFSSAWPDIDLLDIEGRGVLLSGHTENVELLAFSSNGRLLASCSEEHEVIVWTVPSGRMIARATASRPVSQLHISNEGLVSIGLNSGRIELLGLEEM